MSADPFFILPTQRAHMLTLSSVAATQAISPSVCRVRFFAYRLAETNVVHIPSTKPTLVQHVCNDITRHLTEVSISIQVSD